MTKFHHIRP